MLADNDIVLDDNDVSRHHAVIADTGSGFVITDLRRVGAWRQRRDGGMRVRLRDSARLRACVSFLVRH
ncbi:MAG: FHA domain-containing protein [Mycobacteriaceae bacterium]|nr:FHA domain-containing protein [Mycobacteriaceae bacterium]